MNGYQGKSGIVYNIEEPPLASGGEGYVYAIHGQERLVLKLFKPEKRTSQREEKLLKMVEYQLNEQQLEQITWPQDVVYDSSGFVGYVMPRLNENRNLNVVYSQSNNLDLRHRMLIAYNLCAAVDTVHSLNQVCGDLNPQNICVNFNMASDSALRVTLVDTDSYHITDGEKVYRCEVGLANYLAPEIQKKLINGQDLKSATLPTYTKETDLFALAVHIFALLMNGCHPFACAKQTSSGYENTMDALDDTDYDSVVLPQPIENIRDGFFPFHQTRAGVTYPLYAPDFSALPVEIQNLFIRAFEGGYHNPKERPTAEEWIKAFSKYQSPIYIQQCDQRHFYFGTEQTTCAYCAARQRMIQMMGQSIPGGSNQSGADQVPSQPGQTTSAQAASPSSKNGVTNAQTVHNSDGKNYGAWIYLAILVSLFLIGIVIYEYPQLFESGNNVSSKEQGESQYLIINDTHFPDDIFRGFIAEQIDVDSDGYLSEIEINAVEGLELYDQNIEDLTGINYFINLKTLYCAKNKLKTLDVSECEKLEALECSYNQLKSLDVSGCEELVYLSCNNNKLKSLDVSKCKKLKYLYCNDNKLDSVDISNNPNIKVFMD